MKLKTVIYLLIAMSVTLVTSNLFAKNLQEKSNSSKKDRSKMDASIEDFQKQKQNIQTEREAKKKADEEAAKKAKEYQLAKILTDAEAAKVNKDANDKLQKGNDNVIVPNEQFNQNLQGKSNEKENKNELLNPKEEIKTNNNIKNQSSKTKLSKTAPKNITKDIPKKLFTDNELKFLKIDSIKPTLDLVGFPYAAKEIYFKDSVILIEKTKVGETKKERELVMLSKGASTLKCLKNDRKAYFYNKKFIVCFDSINVSNYHKINYLKNGGEFEKIAFDSSLTVGYATINFNDSASTNQFLYKTTNGGNDWTYCPIVAKEKNNFLLIAECFVISALVILLIIAFVLFRNRRKKIKSLIDGIKPKESPLAGITDNPIGKDDKDLLGFENTENAIIGLLKNRDTNPPMTIVLSGSWGSGKSSMMKRIMEKLNNGTSNKFYTTWFNAWHHENEQGVLSSFLLNILVSIQKQSSVRFKFRLFWNRFNRIDFISQFKTVFAVAVILPAVVLIATKLILGLNTKFEGIVYLEQYYNVIKLTLNHIGGTENILELLKEGNITKLLFGMGAGGIGILSILFLHKQWWPSGLSAFIEIVPFNKFKLMAIEQEPGFRQKFISDFNDIMNAIGDNHTMVVFIDDLDRVSGDKIKSLMEAINFIADTASKYENNKHSARIFFCIGMAVEEVVQNLGSVLSDITTDKGDNLHKKAGARFIEKMVDLIVAVPTVEGAETNNLLKLFLRTKLQDN